MDLKKTFANSLSRNETKARTTMIQKADDLKRFQQEKSKQLAEKTYKRAEEKRKTLLGDNDEEESSSEEEDDDSDDDDKKKNKVNGVNVNDAYREQDNVDAFHAKYKGTDGEGVGRDLYYRDLDNDGDIDMDDIMEAANNQDFPDFLCFSTNYITKATIQFLLYITFTFLLLLFVLLPDTQGYNQTEVLYSKFVYRSYEWIGNIDQWYTWMDNGFIPWAFPKEHYNGDIIDTTMNSTLQYQGDFGMGYRIGPVRVRQLRVQETCEIPTIFAPVIDWCYPPYSEDVESTEYHYGEWSSNEDLENGEAYFSVGTQTTYPTQGFVHFLKTNEQAYNKMAMLRNTTWIDRQTRGVFVEFYLYQPELGLTSKVQFSSLLPGSGDMVCEYKFRHTKIFSEYDAFMGKGSSESLQNIMVEFLLFGIVGIIILDRLAYVYYIGIFRACDNFMFLYDTTNYAVLGVVCLMRYSQIDAVGKLTESFQGDTEITEFPELSTIFKIEQQTTFIFAVTGMLTVMKLFYFIKAFKKLTIAVKTLFKAGVDMGYLMILIGIFIFGYGVAYMYIFGYAVNDYSNLSASIFTLYEATLGDFDLSNIKLINRTLAPILFVSFIIAMVFVFISMFVGIVNTHFNATREEALEATFISPEDLELMLDSVHFVGFITKIGRKVPLINRFIPSDNKITKFVLGCFGLDPADEEEDENHHHEDVNNRSLDHLINKRNETIMEKLHRPKIIYMANICKIEAQQRMLLSKLEKIGYQIAKGKGKIDDEIKGLQEGDDEYIDWNDIEN